VSSVLLTIGLSYFLYSFSSAALKNNHKVLATKALDQIDDILKSFDDGDG
jgi:hypothetical protein